MFWGGLDGAESGAAKDVRAALDRYKEAFDVLCQYVLDQGYGLKLAIEPKPNEPRGDILLPTTGHVLAFISELEHPELAGVNPRGRARGDGQPQLRARHTQAMWHGKLFHIDLNGRYGPRYDQDLRFGAGKARGAFWVVDALEAGGYAVAHILGCGSRTQPMRDAARRRPAPSAGAASRRDNEFWPRPERTPDPCRLTWSSPAGPATRLIRRGAVSSR